MSREIKNSGYILINRVPIIKRIRAKDGYELGNISIVAVENEIDYNTEFIIAEYEIQADYNVSFIRSYDKNMIYVSKVPNIGDGAKEIVIVRNLKNDDKIHIRNFHIVTGKCDFRYGQIDNKIYILELKNENS